MSKISLCYSKPGDTESNWITAVDTDSVTYQLPREYGSLVIRVKIEGEPRFKWRHLYGWLRG